MSLRQREYTLESLEQRMLLSGDGLVPMLPSANELPGLAPVDIILVNDQTNDDQPKSGGTDTSVLVDTTPLAPAADLVAEAATVVTQTTNTDTTIVLTTPSTPSALTPPADPLVDSAADLSVITLTSGNGPPAPGSSVISDSGSDAMDDLSAWDPPLGGFNFTATHADVPTRDAQYAALTALFTTGTSGSPVEMVGKIENRAGALWPLGALTLEGTLFFARQMNGATPVVDGSGNAVFKIWFSGLTGKLQAGTVTLNLNISAGAFLVNGNLATPDTTGGMTGLATVTTASITGATGNTIALSGLTGVSLSLNTTGAIVPTTTISDGLSPVTFNFTTNQQLLRVAGSLSMSVTSSSVAVTLRGDIGFEIVDLNGATAGGHTLVFALASGYADLTVGGVTLTASGLAGAFLINNTGIAGWASVGGIAATGIPSGFSFGELSNVSVNFNTTGADVSVTDIPVGSGTTDIVYAGAAQQNFFRVTGTVALNVDHGGISTKIKGTLTFDRSVDTVTSAVILRVAVLDAASSFTAGGTTLAITDIDGAFVIKNNGFAGKATVGGITLTGVTGFTFSVTNLFFEINTTGGSVTDSIASSGSPVVLDFAAPDRHQFLRVQGGVDLGLDLGGIAVRLNGTFYFEQYDPDGAGTAPNVVKFAAIGATASFTAGTVKLEVTGVDGGFLVTNAGIAGFVTADAVTLTGVTGVTLAATGLSFAINTTGAATGPVTFGVVGGPSVSFDYSASDEWSFVSVAGTLAPLSLTLGAASVEVTGSIAFYGGTVDGTEVIKIGFADLGASVTIGPVTAALTQVDGIILLLDAGIAGRVTFGELSIAGISGFSLTATGFAFEFNNTGLEIDEALTVGAVSQTLQYTALDNETDFFRGSGTASLAFTSGSFSTTLTGTFGFEQYAYDPDGAGGAPGTNVVKFAFTDVHFEVAVSTAKLVINDADGFFIFGENSTGVDSYAGRLQIADAELQGVTGLTLAVSNFTFEVNTFGEAVDAEITRPSLPSFALDFTAVNKHNFLALGGTVHLGIAIGGFSSTLNATLYFEKTVIGLDTYMKVSVSAGSFDLTAGSITLAATGISGAFLIMGNGKSAGQLAIGHVGLTGIRGLTFTVDDFALQFNNTNGAVSVNIPVPGDPAGVDLDFTDPEFHDFIRVGGELHLGLTVGGFSATIQGTFLFEQTATKIKVGLKDAGLTVVAGSITLDITDVNGAFVIYDGGTMATQLTIGHVALTGITGFTFTVDDFFLNINNTGNVAGVHEHLVFGDGTTVDIDFDDDILALGGTLHLGLTVGSFNATIAGTFLFEQTAAKMKIGLKDAGITITAGSVGLAITDVDGAFVIYSGGTMAIQLSIGHVELTGIGGFVFTVDDFFLSINNTGNVGGVHEHLVFGDGSTTDIDFDEDILALGGTLHLSLTVGSFTAAIEGTFLFEQTASKIKVGLKDAGMTIQVGVVKFEVDDMDGAFVIYAGGGLAATVSINSVSLTGIPGVSLSVEDFFLDINNTGNVAGVHEHLVFGDGSTTDIDYATDVLRFGGTIKIGIGGTPANPYVRLTAVGVVVNTTATGSQHVFEAASLSGQLLIPSLGTITVTASNLAVTADGQLANLAPADPFVVEVTFGGAGGPNAPNASSFNWPTWLPIEISHLALLWNDVGAHPDQFILVLSASIKPIAGLPLTFSGMVDNLRLDVGKLIAGEFPILGFDAAAVQISGTLFGLTVTGGVIIGMIDFDAAGDIIDRSDPANATVIADGTIFYFGIRASITIAGVGGAGFSLGLADIDPTDGIEIVPLEAMISVQAPIIIEPISGLTLGAFFARVQFASTLVNAHYELIANLKAESIANATNPTLAAWERGLKESTLSIYLDAASAPGVPVDVWSKPMVITAAVTLYSSYISPQALNGTLMVKFDTQGRLLLIGELVFGGGSMKMDAKLYTDLTNTAGGVSFSFYASYGTAIGGQKPFELEGTLQIRLLDASRNELTAASHAGAVVVQVKLTGSVTFTQAGALVVKVAGSIFIEVDYTDPATTVVTLVFNAQVGLIAPTPNPLGPNFAELAGSVVIFVTGGEVEMYGAVKLTFTPASLAQYGIDISATAFLQINTLDTAQDVELVYLNGTTETVTIRENSFSIYLKGDLTIGPPNSAPSAAFLKMNGFVIIELNSDGLTFVFDVELQLAPGGTRLLTLDATGFMRINTRGIAARLDLTLVTDFPPSSGLDLTASFLLIINTTDRIVTYDIPDFVLTGAPGEVTSITIAQAAPEIGPIGPGLLTEAADGITAPGEDYYIIAVDGDLTALSFTLSGDFFIVITPGRVQLQVNAELTLDPLGALEVHGFLDVTSGGAAGLLDVALDLTALDTYGIDVTGTFVLAFNTYATDYTLPNAVADRFSLPHGSTLVAGLIRVEISGDVTIGSILSMSGRFFFEKTPTQTILEVDATMAMPVVGTLLIDGDLVLTSDGVVGSLVASIQSAGGLADIGITFSATLLLKVNTTSAAADDPGVVDPAVLIAADTVILDLSGSVTLLGQFAFNGHFYFKKSGANLQITFDATLNIAVGTFQVTGDFSSTAAGFKAQLTLALQTSPSLASMGFKLHGDFLLAINSATTAMTLGGLTGNLASFNGQTLATDTLKIYVSGGITILDSLELTGTFELTQGPGYLEIKVTAHVSLDGLVTLNVTGFAGIYSDGIVLSFDLEASFGISGLFEASGLLEFRLNTTGSTHNGITADYFRIHVGNLTLRFLSVLTVSGSLDFTYSAGAFTLSVSASVDFFGLGSISASGYFDSDGNYSVDFHGHVGIGIDGFFGIFGDVSFHIDGSNESVLHLSGSISGSAYLVGIGFGVNVGIQWDANSGRLRASVEITIDFFFFSISFGGDFDLGYIKSTVTYQAGTLADAHAATGDAFPGGALWVNVGARGGSRNYSETEVKEQVFIRQDADGRIEIELFGKKKKYANVTEVRVSTGGGNDYVYVDASVTIPVFIDLGDGDDAADVAAGSTNNGIEIIGGAGRDTITGGGGNDQIWGDYKNDATSGDADLLKGGGGNDTIHGGGGDDVITGGAGADSVYGEAGSDAFTWSSGDGADSVISGGAGTNSLSLDASAGANSLAVTANGSNFTANIDGFALSPTGVGSLYANLRGGADTVTIGYLGGTIVASVDLALGYNDGAVDTVTIAGSGSDDVYRLSTTSINHHVPTGTNYNVTPAVTSYSDFTTTLLLLSKAVSAANPASQIDYRIDEGGYAEDRVVLNAGDGADLLDAHNVAAAAVKLTLNGGNQNDTIIGSSFADTLNGGAGDDTVTGGPGLDTFLDASGSDTLIEYMDRNYTLNGWTLNAGGAEAESLPAVFETIRLTGGNSANTFTISNVATTVWLDGGEGDDVYLVTVAGTGVSNVHVADGGTGVGFSNTNTLKIYGTAGTDTFLLRAGQIQVGDLGAHNELITMAGLSAFEIWAGDGNDSFIVDETTVAANLNGENGEDSFTVGRILAVEGQPAPAGIQTIDTTRGFLAYGNKAALEMHGGNQNDYFEVNHNQAGLRLYGEAGDDLFLIRTFLEEGSALSTVSGGTGLNSIRYVANGPVFIDGGQGFDRIVLEGTEADDVFIVTDTQIFGGGRKIDFVNIEGIVILGGQGNDTFWVLGNDLPLEIQGGSGNDVVHIGGQAPDYVYDAPPIIIDPPAYTTYTPVYSAPITFSITIPAHFTFSGGFPFFAWVPTFTFSFTIPPMFLGFQATVIDPPPYTVDPNPITYRFANVTNFNGVVNGVEQYDAPNATPVTPGPGVTPTSRVNLGVITAPVKFVGGDDTGVANENDRLLVHLQGTTGNLTGTMGTAQETNTDDHGVVTYTAIGQLLGLGLPDAFTNQGHDFLGGITYRGVESAQFDLGSGNDTFNVGSTFDDINVTVNGNAGTDTFNVQGNSGTLVLNGGAGNDTFNLDSNAPGAGNGTLDNLTGAMTLNGGTETDSLYLDDRADGSDNVMTLTASTIVGLDTGGVTYTGFEGLTIALGGGNDTANLVSLAIPTSLNTGGGLDLVYVGSTAGAANTNGNVHGIATILTIDGGTGGASVTLDDTGDGAAHGGDGTLTGTTVTGLGLGGVLTYANLSTLTINLGGGGNTFTIAGTHAGTTNLATGGGIDAVSVRTVSGATNVNTGGNNDVIRVGSVAPAAANGTLNGLVGLLTLDGGAGSNQLFVDDTLDSAANTGAMTGATITGLGMSAGLAYSNFAALTLALGSGHDFFEVSGTHAGTTALNLGLGDDTLEIDRIAGVTTVAGNGGADVITVNPDRLTTGNPIGAVLNLDGNDGGDNYHVWFSGQGASLINVLDTGAGGTNNLTLNGTPFNDTYLLRKDFVVLLQYVGGVQQATYERINYNGAINGVLTLNAIGGANYFAIDDNSSVTVINGADGAGDTYQIGQVYGDSFVGAGFAAGDLIATTRGLLSPGITHKLTVNGGTGEDFFTVFHNRAVLDLNGGDGDDTFTIRSFALTGSSQSAESYDPLRGATNVATGGGTNHVAYSLNAPVNINGGSGFNSVVIILTEFSDSIIVTQAGVYGAGLFISLTNVQELIVHAAEGNDNIWVLGTPANTSVRIVGGLGSDTIHLGGAPDPIEIADLNPDGSLTGTSHWVAFPPVTTLTDINGPLFVDGGTGDGVPPLTPGTGLPGEATGPLNFAGNPTLGVSEPHQVDRLIAHNEGSTAGETGLLTGLRLSGLGLVDATTIAGVAFAAGVGYTELEEVIVNLGSGNDTFTIEGTHAGRTVISAADGADTVNVRAISGHTTVLGGNGADTVNVGSLAPGTGGNVDGIDALLALDGGAGTDTVNVDQRGNAAGSTGWLTQTTLTGLEMTSGVATVNDAITLRVNATGGSFKLTSGASQVTVAWNATFDDLTAALWTLLGNRNGFAQKLGGEFLINFQGDLKGQAVVLSVDASSLVNGGAAGSVAIAHRIDGANYYGVETLNLDLGSGADVFNVQGTTAVTNLNTRNGEDRIYVSSAASLTTSTFTDWLRGHLDNVTGTLNLDAGTGRNLLMVSDEASAAANGSLATPALITGGFIRGFAPAQINYLADAATGSFAQGITVWTGAGADVIDVTGTDTRAGLRTTTTVNTGAGADRVTVSLNAAADGFFVLNTQEGDDWADASASSLPVIVFGGAGADTILGGGGNDVLFGDHGRVNYLDGSGNVVAVLGGGGPGDLTDGIIRDTLRLFTVDPVLGAADTISGNNGDDIILGGAAGDLLGAGEGDNVVFGDHGTVTVAGGLATLIDSLLTGGGNDTISAGTGRDLILGGTGMDGINAGAGGNVVFGDHGTLVLAANIVTSAATVTGSDGDVDTIATLGGRDFILGGEAGDIIDAGEGDNAVAGDHGVFTIVSPTAFSFTSTASTVGGDDTIATGAGADTLIGGLGNDGLAGGDGRNVVFGDHGTLARDTAAANITATATFESTGGIDTIATGLDADLILGGAANDIITSGAGDDLVFGDAGTATVAAGLPVSLATTAPDSGGDDNIQAGDGADVVFGGDGADGIVAGDGRNVVFGDHGLVVWGGALLVSATTTAPGVGGVDTIATGADDDIVFGGTAGDAVTTNAGHDVVFGDQGLADFTTGRATLLTNSPVAGGGVDGISTGAGDDVVLGGDAGDLIDAGGDANTVAGDFASITRPDLGSGPVTTLLTTLFAGQGGDDRITTGGQMDLVAGGHGSDTIVTGDGFKVILGDAGEIALPGGILDYAVTFGISTGADVISVGNGNHDILGGLGADTITVAGGVNVIHGDQGRIDVTGLAPDSSTTLDAGLGAGDVITVGAGQHWIFGGDGDDSVTVNNGGFTVVFGDHGRIDRAGSTLTVVSQDFAIGGADTIATGAGVDVILGGYGADTIQGGDGDNVVLGDHGRVIRDALTGLALVTTIAPTEGAADSITTGAGNDIILGGAGADVIHAGAGRNAVLGDHGRFDFTAGDLRTATVSDYTIGGGDLIDAGIGADLVFGGFGADTIDAGDGDNVVLGDQGTVVLSGGVLIDVYTEQVAVGAGDIIVSGAGRDVILGGFGLDRIDAGDGNNFIVGDHAELHWVLGILARMLSTDFADGAADSIVSGSGNDVILAGPDHDTVNAGNGQNLVFGDNGSIFWTGGVIDRAVTTATAIGGIDTLISGAGHDLIFGGTAGDVIDAGDGDNVIVGDHGEAGWLAGIRSYYLTFAPDDAGDDAIASGAGHDTILAGAGADTITAGNGNNLVFGDEAEITYDAAGVIVEADSLTPAEGANDTIATGAGHDTIIGGVDLDTIDAGGGNNVVFGDNGELTYAGGLAALYQTITPQNSHNDTIVSGGGHDIILAGNGTDTVNAGDGNNIVLGDEGLITLSAGVVQIVASEAFAQGLADVITTGAGHDLIVGGQGADTLNAGDGNNVVAGDNAVLTLPGGVLAQLAALAPAVGAADLIVTGAGNDVIMAGVAGDDVNAGEGNNVVIGDHATVTFAGAQFATLTPTTPGIGGNDTLRTGAGADRIVGGTGLDWIDAGNGHNVVVGDHAVILQPLGVLGTVNSVAPADGAADLIFTGTGNDLVIGGTGGDTIHSGAGNDLVFGDHALVTGTISLDLLPLAMAVKPFTFTATITQNIGPDGRPVGGDDVVFAGAGDDIVFGQQGADILFGGDGDDDLVGGHNVSLGQDGADVLDGGAGFDVLAGDNAAVLRTGNNLGVRAHVLAGTAMFDDRGVLLDLDTPQAWPTAVPERAIVLLDHAFDTIAGVFAADQLVGGAGDDVVFGQLGNDSLHGDATLPVAIAADGTIDRAAVRAAATALFTTNPWVGADSDGDDYIEGNGGNDLIFGGLGQDDIVGGSSSLFGLLTREQRPDGSDTLYGGNGTAAGFEDMGDGSLNGRARDSDLIMGDNANVFRLVGLNGVAIGAFLTFSYDAAGTQKIIVRAFDLLDYTVPASVDDIGAVDTIYGEAGDDTLHGQVGADVLLGNGNDDNLYGGQGDDLIFGGGGDDAISHSDELKPPPPAENRTPKGPQNRDDDTPGGPGGTLVHVAANAPAALFTTPGFVKAVYLTDLYLGFSNTSSWIQSNPGAVFPNGGSAWRLFGDGIFPSHRFGTHAVNAAALPANEGFVAPLAPATEIPATPEAPATPPPAGPQTEATPPPAGNEDKPARDQPADAPVADESPADSDGSPVRE